MGSLISTEPLRLVSMYQALRIGFNLILADFGLKSAQKIANLFASGRLVYPEVTLFYSKGWLHILSWHVLLKLYLNYCFYNPALLIVSQGSQQCKNKWTIGTTVHSQKHTSKVYSN